MVFRLDEIMLLLGSLALCLAPVGLGWLALRAKGVKPTTLLTPREWRLTYKIIAILVFALLLHLTHLSLSLPPELFIYGRF